MENKRVLVIGGTGYIGKELVDELIRRGYSVKVISRKAYGEHILQGSVLDKEFLSENIKNFDYVIYLTAVIRSILKSRYKQNATGLGNVIDVMNENKIRKIIYFSTMNVNIKKTGHYGNSKKECEKIIKESSLDYVIIRPNYVYGIDKNNYFYDLIKTIRRTKICPVIGFGGNKIQPVNKNDLARITADVLRYFNPGETIEVSGRNAFSINEVIAIIKKEGNFRFLKFYIPITFLKLFKRFIPFDVDGFDEDRISIKNDFSFGHNLRDDIKEMMKL